jgi:hypothetical protein
MKRPKVVRRRYTREAWKRKEDQCMKALSQYLEANKEKFKQSFERILLGQPFGYQKIHPKIQHSIVRAKAEYEKETSP